MHTAHIIRRVRGTWLGQLFPMAWILYKHSLLTTDSLHGSE